HGFDGGAILVAAGLYPYFVLSVADVAGLRPSRRSLIVLAFTFGSAAIAILTLSGLAQVVASEMRWAAYSLFVGVALGGLVVSYGMLRPLRAGTWLFLTLGATAGVALAAVQKVEPVLTMDVAPGFGALVAGGVASA